MFKCLLEYLSYLSPVIEIVSAIIITIATGFIAWVAIQNRKIFKAQTTPIIAFGQTKIKDEEGKDKKIWYIENVGNGPALDIRVAHIFKIQNKEYICKDKESKKNKAAIIQYNIIPARSEPEPIEWENRPEKLIAKYIDIYKKKYTSICEGSVSTFYEKDVKIPGWENDEKMSKIKLINAPGRIETRDEVEKREERKI